MRFLKLPKTVTVLLAALMVFGMVGAGVTVSLLHASAGCVDYACSAASDCIKHSPCNACEGDAGKKRCAIS